MNWWNIIRFIMNGISFILNGIFLFVLARNKDLVKRKRITYHVANIAVADTLYGLGSFCSYIVSLHRFNEARYKIFLLFLLMYYVGYFTSQAAVLLMTIERSIVITKPLTWNEILPRKRMSLFMLCSWIAVVTLQAVSVSFFLIQFTWGKRLTVLVVMYTLHTLFLLSTAAVNIYMFKKLQQLPHAANHQKSIHLKHKASILVLLLTVIMIVTCLPNSLLSLITLYVTYIS